MDCCNKSYNFCEPVSPCNMDDLLQLIKSIFTTPGSYVLKLLFFDNCIKYRFDISAEGDFTFTDSDSDIQTLNENYLYKAQLLNLDGDIVNVTEDYECFSFKTKFCF